MNCMPHTQPDLVQADFVPELFTPKMTKGLNTRTAFKPNRKSTGISSAAATTHQTLPCTEAKEYVRRSVHVRLLRYTARPFTTEPWTGPAVAKHTFSYSIGWLNVF